MIHYCDPLVIGINVHKRLFLRQINSLSKLPRSLRLTMKTSRQQRVCKALCCSCNCRLSVSSSSEEAESSVSDRFPSVSSLAHAMVQERLDQMIRERHVERSRRYHHHHHQRREDQGTKFVVMVAMEKCSYNPREDFRESMVEMIMTNRLQDAKDLRSLLNYYVSMNSQEYHSLILEVFHEDFVKVVEDSMHMI